MGCVSSALLSHDDDFTQMGGSSAAFAHHIVSLKSTTYGFLTLDSPPPTPPPPSTTTTVAPTPPPRFTLASLSSTDLRSPLKPEIINSWELMAGLDSSTPPPLAKPDSVHSFRFSDPSKGNSNPNLVFPTLEGFEKLCPPDGENKVVVYTTTLRGIRKTFEACNAVRAAIEGMGVSICERDISMDRGFREELRELMKGKGEKEVVPPRVFVRGRYIGGAEEVMRIAEEMEENGGLSLRNLLSGLPKLKAGYVCEGCGGARFLPCSGCNGSCKVVNKSEEVVRCPECNENGLIICPICT